MRFLPNAFKESKVVIKILQNALPSCFMFYLLLVLGVLALSVERLCKNDIYSVVSLSYLL